MLISRSSFSSLSIVLDKRGPLRGVETTVALTPFLVTNIYHVRLGSCGHEPYMGEIGHEADMAVIVNLCGLVEQKARNRTMIYPLIWDGFRD